ncbi:hypothetical protein BT69DRAFT_1192677, partial [Atractiella rhizophila]
LERALLLRQAFDGHTEQSSFKLKKYEVMEPEWKVLGELQDVLKPFYRATVKLSTKVRVLLSAVIPYLDKFDHNLRNIKLNRNANPFIQLGACLAIAVLNKYYSKACQETSMYKLAIVLHPFYKLKYYEHAGWLTSWIQEIRTLLREEFKTY